MTDRPAADKPARGRLLRLGLSGKLLVLTILFVMIAEVLIYVPSIANFRFNWLHDRLSAAYTAALVLDAAPSGMVPENPRPPDPRLGRCTRRRHEDGAAAPSAGRRRDAARPSITTSICATCPGIASIIDAFDTLLSNDNDVMRVVGPAPMGGEFVEIVLDEKPLRAAMLRFSVNILLLSLLISGITATLVYVTLHYMFVRPLHRITANMTAFRDEPENPARIIVASGRHDEVGTAERELAGMQSDLASLLQQKSHLASLGLAVSKINHDLRNLLTSAQLFSERLAKISDPHVQRFTPALMRALERAIAFCESTLSYGRVQEPPPDRQTIALEPLVDQVRETLGLDPGAPVRWISAVERGLDGRCRSRSAVPRTAQPRAQRRAGARWPGRQGPRQRAGPRHRPARRRCGGDRGLRHRAGTCPRRRAPTCSRLSRARRAAAAPGSVWRSPPNSCVPTAATSGWSTAPSGRPSASPFPDRAVELETRRNARARG